MSVIVVRSLMAVLLLLNGLVMQPSAASHAATGMAAHTGHVPNAASAASDFADDASHAHHSMGTTGDDCCETATCDCGCAAPHAATLPVAVQRTSWQAALPSFAFSVKSFHSEPFPAPFRPPA